METIKVFNKGIKMDTDEIKLKILQKSEELFVQFGFSKVTVDEIAQSLGMSKKTIYTYFKSKEDILLKMLEGLKNNLKKLIDPILENQHISCLEKMNRIMPILASQISKMRGRFAEDLMKYSPEIWNQILIFRREHIFQHFGQIIRQGISEGLIQKNIDERLIIQIYTSIIEGVFNPQLLSSISHSAEEVYRIVLHTFFFGILTEEGKQCCPTITNLNMNSSLQFGEI